MKSGRLPDLIELIYAMLNNNVFAKNLFSLNLLKCGYNHNLAEKYDIAFSISDEIFYHVLDNFPKLLNVNLPNGIGDLKYSVMLAACEPFKININSLTLI